MPRSSHPPLSRTSLSGVTVEGLQALDMFRSRGGAIERRDVVDGILALADHAPALLPLAYADPLLLVDVLERPLTRGDTEASMHARFLAATAELDDGPELRRVLRRLRHRAVVRIALREIERVADVDETAAEMAALASAATHAAYLAVRRSFEARHGAIVDAAGVPIPFVVLGMGKLGGGELNLGSDVDFLYLYGTDEGHVGDDGKLSVHDAFTRVARRLSSALSDATEDGFCFRIDLRLRPEGSHGPLVNSLASAERYYESFGRPWERAAMLRARPVAGELATGADLIDALRGFVYRRMPDPKIAIEMRNMVERSRRELARDVDRDVKLCRGGIREAEFFVQTLQLLWGGQHRSLQTPSTTQALRQLRSVGLVDHREATQLGEDWALLRRVEHRIHVWTGYQTHALPLPGPERERFARSLGYRDAASFELEFDAARRRVANLFDGLLEDGQTEPPDPGLDLLVHRVVTGAAPEEIAASVAEALDVDDADEATSHLRRMARNPHAPFGAIGYARAPDLAPRLLREVRATAYPDAALRHLAEFFSRVGADFGYDKVLAEQPMLTRRLVGLFGASGTLAAAMIGHPETVDQIFAAYTGLPTDEAIREAHHDGHLANDADLDPERIVSALRRTHREITLRIGLAYIAGDADLEGVGKRLSTLAECQLEIALQHATAEAEEKHGEAWLADRSRRAGFCIVAMGKLGSRELGFGSDLDLVFFFETEGFTDGGPGKRSVTFAEHFAKIGQRILRILENPDPEGRGFVLDTRLRPNGTQSPLVQSLAAFDAYFSGQASGWERQALTRARPAVGDAPLAEALRRRIVAVAFEQDAPPAEHIAQMRRRIELELAGERPGRYHVKYGYGGLMDVEFIAQWLAMRHGRDPRVRALGTVETLRALRTVGALGDDDLEALVEAYELAREIEQTSKLLDDHREAVIVPDGPIADRIARRLRMRTRDGVEPSAVLVESWIRTASEVRAIFDRLVAPVEARSPFPAYEADPSSA